MIRRYPRILSLVLVPVALLVGCGSDDEPGPTSATTSTGGAGGEGGTDVGGGGAGAEGGGGSHGEENQPDHDALAACGTPTCGELFAQRIEGGDPFTINNGPCTLTALRDRTEGAYDVLLDHSFGNGGATRKIRLFVTASGEVEIGEVLQEDVEGVLQTPTLLPTQRCTLKDVAFFDDCLGYVESGNPDGGPGAYPDTAYACIFPGLEDGTVPQDVPWFASCEDLAPTCE